MIRASPSEWRFVAGVIIGVLLLFGGTLALGYLSTPDGAVFLGTHSINAGDTPVYYSWIEQTREGSVLHRNLYTPDEHPPFLLNIFWLGGGLAARVFSLSAIATYHGARFLLIPALLAVLYVVAAFFFETVRERRIALLLIVLSSGIGGLVVLLVGEPSGLHPIDLWVPEAFVFLTLSDSPHFMMSDVLMLLTFLFFIVGQERHSFRYTIAAGATALLLFQFHPYHAPTVYAVVTVSTAAWVALGRARFRDSFARLAAMILVSCPALVYYAWTLHAFPIQRQYAVQNVAPLPDLAMTLASYGALPVFAAAGLMASFRAPKRSDREIFLISWLAAQLLVLALPFPFRRRLTQGLQIVLALLAAGPLSRLLSPKDRPSPASPNWLGVALAVLLFFGSSNLSILMRDWSLYVSQSPQAYVPANMFEAFRWLRANTPRDAIVLSSYPTNGLIAAFGLRQVYVAHWGMTADFRSRYAVTSRFFSEGGTSDERVAFLRSQGIDYLFLGPKELVSGAIDPRSLPLPLSFVNGCCAIFEVGHSP